MKSDNHPLVKAMQSRNVKPSGTPFAPMEGPRTFEIQHHEIPGLPGRRVGEPITVRLQGHIHSQHNDGKAVIHVASVKPDTSGTEEKQYPEQNVPERGIDDVRVRTQQSHA